MINSDKFKKNSSRILTFWIVFLIGFMSVAYAVFFTELKIDISGSASNNWKINFEEFEDISNGYPSNYIVKSTPGSTGGEVKLENNQQTFSITNAQINNYGSYLYYVMPVVNEGNIDAYLQSIDKIVTVKDSRGRDITQGSDNQFLLNVTLYKTDSLTSDESNATYLVEGAESGLKNNVEIKGTSTGNSNKVYLAMKISLDENNDALGFSENTFEVTVTPSWASETQNS